MNQSTPAPYRISTITATANIGTELIDLQVLYDSLNIIDDDSKNGIIYIEYGEKKSETFFKGYNKKTVINRRKNAVNKRFDNQITVVFRYVEESCTSNVNIKIFKNANVQMTGIKYPEQGVKILNKLILLIGGKLEVRDYRIRLINSDFKVEFEINRERLFKIITNDYNNVCTFEACSYPGCKIAMFVNVNNPLNDGRCYCQKPCIDGKGDGITSCKKITIAVFQSGCVIITGAFNIKQIDDAYKFITRILYDNVEFIEKKKVIQPVENIVKKTIVYLRRSAVRQLTSS